MLVNVVTCGTRVGGGLTSLVICEGMPEGLVEQHGVIWQGPASGDSQRCVWS